MNVDAGQRLLAAPRFAAMLEVLAKRSVLGDLVDSTDPGVVDWNYALLGASFLAGVQLESCQDAVLRVAQGCLSDSDANEAHREAAVILLERTGNHPAVELAESRELVAEGVWEGAPPPLVLDVIRRRVELGIPLADGTVLAGNPFQRDFWTAANRSQWVSVSAPTSAGKSFIVKRWFADRVQSSPSFRAVYLVPTRALIEEVSAELKADMGETVSVYTLPWDAKLGSTTREIFVVTQERLHIIQQDRPDLAYDVMFVDEAQKFGDGTRGVLLQQVVDDFVSKNPTSQVLFASPLSSNPELLLDLVPPGVVSETLNSQSITVNQNLLWVNQTPRKPLEWQVELVTSEATRLVGRLTLPSRPIPASKRLPLVAVALAGSTPGNVVYVNGAADAEKTAQQIFEALGPEADISSNRDIAALRELVERTIHVQYALARVLNRGIAFHYGNIPLLVRAEIERLFKAGTLRYLVCTSTLLEGVNLPCRNVFARGPRKGRGTVMSAADFWNLAGRAGRWGKEFEGNIVCVDTSDENAWPNPPSRRERQPLTRSTDDVLADPERLQSYIDSGTPVPRAAERIVESVFSYLVTRVATGAPLQSIPGMRQLDPVLADVLTGKLTAALAAVDIPTDLIVQHAGISPVSMQRLLDYFRTYSEQSNLVLAPPESNDATESYVRALARCVRFIGGDFGVAPGRHWVLAMLIVNWMRGHPLARIIANRLQYLESLQRDYSLAAVIRDTMNDVEQIARFEAPKYLSCYLDLLKVHFEATGNADSIPDLPEISMLLELGVSRTTEFSLMTLGLSRTSAIALSEFIVEDDLTPEQCVVWVRDRDLASLGLPVLILAEINRVLLSQ